MAAPVTPNDLKKLTQINYDKVRKELVTGDIVFCSGGYLFSKIIQKLTKSTWSHVAVVYKDEELGRVLLLEAEPLVGIRLIPLSKYLFDYKGKRKSYKGKIVVAKLTDKIEKSELNKGISFGLDELTRPYDNWEIVRIMLRILFKAGRKEKNRAYICSELVRDVFKKAGITFPMKDSYISPDAIWQDPRVMVKHRVL